ncbi:MAG: dTDP-4-dehydrorhamnose reductase [Azospirillaceae bacterium]
MAGGIGRRVLLLGGSGQVGQALRHLVWPEGWTLDAPPRSGLDLSRPGPLEAALDRCTADLVINCAGFTAVDLAEEASEEAFAVNQQAVAALARVAARHGWPVVHLSTDYVFDGRAGRAYRAEDPVAPLNVYGASKAAGEAALRMTCPDHWIVRTAWVTGRGGGNFLHAILKASLGRPVLRIVDDQWGSPSPASLLADRLRSLAIRLLGAGERPAPGTFHLAGDEPATWHGLARSAFEVLARHRPDWPQPELVPIAMADWPTRAPRPRDTRLDSWPTLGALGVAPLPWRAMLAGEVLEIAHSLRPAAGAAVTGQEERAS